MENINQHAWELKATVATTKLQSYQPYNMNKIWLILRAENAHKLSIK